MMHAKAANSPQLAFIAAAPALLALACAMIVPERRALFLGLLLLAALLVSLFALPRALRCLPKWRAAALLAAFVLPLLLPLLPALLLLAMARLALLWHCRRLQEPEAARLAPGFPLLDAALVAGAALAAVSTW